jgi:hypothetical protein
MNFLEVSFCTAVFLTFCQRLRLGDVAEIEAQNFKFALKFNWKTELEFSTKPAILPNIEL